MGKAESILSKSFFLHCNQPSPADAAWNKMLLAMWKNSALPIERGIMVRNALGDYMAATPVQDIHSPFDNQMLPDTFGSPAWGCLQNPTRDSECPLNAGLCVALSLWFRIPGDMIIRHAFFLQDLCALHKADLHVDLEARILEYNSA